LFFRFAGALAHDDAIFLLLDDRRRCHPVKWTKSARIVMYEEGAIGFEHQQPHGFRKAGGEAAGVEDFAAGDEKTHGSRTVLSVSDMPRDTSLGHVPTDLSGPITTSMIKPSE